MTQRSRRVGFVSFFLVLVCLVSTGGSRLASGTHSSVAPESANARLTILLTNDDGYDAPGLQALIEAVRPVGDLYVVAPATDQSGKSHSLATSREPIFVTEKKRPEGGSWYAVEAPPATCVRLAVGALLPRRPDVVISGINRGENLGVVVYYSGTLGAAREAVIAGLPAIAVSAQVRSDQDYAPAGAFLRQLLERLQAKQMLKPGLFLNVNVPAGEPKGVRVTRLSVKPNEEIYERRTSPQGRPYFWSQYRPVDDDGEGTDVRAFVRGYITLTPMQLDATSPKGMDPLHDLALETVTPVAR